MLIRILTIVVGLALLALLALYALGSGVLGNRWEIGTVAESRVAAAVLEKRQQRQNDARESIGVAMQIGKEKPKQILFGDLHVHSTFSLDAFMMALPTAGEDGARPVHGYAHGLDQLIARAVARNVDDLGDHTRRRDLEGVVAEL